jgi:threonine/homoserine/homoserine lactone efflux protein
MGKGKRYIHQVLTNVPALIFACLILAIIPGPALAVQMRYTLRGGRRAGLVTLAGVESGVLLWSIAAAFGLSALLTVSTIAYNAVKVVGVVVLVWMGIQAIRSARNATDMVIESSGSLGSGYRSGLMVNLANPKAGVFAISFLPQFVAPGTANPAILMLAAVIWSAVDTLWFMAVIMLMHRLGGQLRKAKIRKRVEQTTGGILIALGIRLALE